MQGKRFTARIQPVPISQHACRLEVKRHWQLLKEEESMLAETYVVLAEGIWPDQCKRLLALLCRIEKPLQALPTCLKDSVYPSSSVIENHYPLLLCLRQADEQVQTIIPLIVHLSSACRFASKQAVEQGNEVRQRLKTLLKICSEILNALSRYSV